MKVRIWEKGVEEEEGVLWVALQKNYGSPALCVVDVKGELRHCGLLVSIKSDGGLSLHPCVNDELGLPLVKCGYVRTVHG
jgi:hypothetical protein